MRGRKREREKMYITLNIIILSFKYPTITLVINIKQDLLIK